MTQTMLERAARAARDAMLDRRSASYESVARAVLLAVRGPGQSIMDDAFSDVLEPVYPGDFGRVIDAILNEPQR